MKANKKIRSGAGTPKAESRKESTDTILSDNPKKVKLVSEYCVRCKYYSNHSNSNPMCNYILMVGKPRP